eukprot:CAMPEP_0168519546 /NCGR_PEP_ID=MMETSP0405-20121227/7388_1 /TAXON_ID=498012 /ORGANISM="Trichosphaerium sp, Strain Am-I-7 wt" /LENGTH=58 /DNA_ID=CAMNT_0008540121 /DNA_START=141 /DNA_END=317 /DNA_ORIENTATION=+
MIEELNVFENKGMVDLYVSMTWDQHDKDQNGQMDEDEFLVLYKRLLKNAVEKQEKAAK